MPRNSADDDARQLRRAKALELRVKGKLTVREIAKELGVSPYTAHHDIHQAIEEETKDLPDMIRTHREVETRFLDEWQAKVMARLEPPEDATGAAGSPPDVDEFAKLTGILLKISERRAKLLGLDAPIKTETDVRGIALDDLTVLRDAVRANECPPET